MGANMYIQQQCLLQAEACGDGSKDLALCMCINACVYIYIYICIYIYIYIGSPRLLEPHTMGWGGGVGC